MTPVCNERDPTPDAVPETLAPSELTQVESEIRVMQRRPGKYVYAGSVADVMGDGRGSKGAFRADADEARTFARRLEREVMESPESPEWAAVALVHEAEMFERLRDVLAKLQVHDGPGAPQPGEIELMTPQQKALLATMAASGRGGLVNKKDELEDAVRGYWKEKKRQELTDLDERVLRAYGLAAKRVDTKAPAATRAVRRLGRYTRELGNERMAKLIGDEYVPDVYLRMCAALDTANIDRAHSTPAGR